MLNFCQGGKIKKNFTLLGISLALLLSFISPTFVNSFSDPGPNESAEWEFATFPLSHPTSMLFVLVFAALLFVVIRLAAVLYCNVGRVSSIAGATIIGATASAGLWIVGFEYILSSDGYGISFWLGREFVISYVLLSLGAAIYGSIFASQISGSGPSVLILTEGGSKHLGGNQEQDTKQLHEIRSNAV